MKPPVTLAKIDGTELHVACGRCGLNGRFDVARAIKLHGPDLALPMVLRRVTEGCKARRTTGRQCSAVCVSLRVRTA